MTAQLSIRILIMGKNKFDHDRTLPDDGILPIDKWFAASDLRQTTLPSTDYEYQMDHFKHSALDARLCNKTRRIKKAYIFLAFRVSLTLLYI